MRARLHGLIGSAAWLCIAGFWSSTLIAELFLSPAAVVTVKTSIAWSLLAFVPLMIATAGSGFALAAGRSEPLLAGKRRRMPLIGANGLLVLVPAALYLQAKAVAGEFDTAFYTVQGVELLAGAANLWLIGRSLRDGLRLRAQARSGGFVSA